MIEAKSEDTLYPHWKYSPVHDATVVNSAIEEEELGEGWFNSPAEYGVVSAPSVKQIRDAKLGIVQAPKDVEEEQGLGPAPRRRRA